MGGEQGPAGLTWLLADGKGSLLAPGDQTGDTALGESMALYIWELPGPTGFCARAPLLAGRVLLQLLRAVQLLWMTSLPELAVHMKSSAFGIRRTP